MLTDDTCWFLAADFDEQTWQQDAKAFLATCQCKGISAALERSRSGNGGHVWIFFSEPVLAAHARLLGTHLLTETMERNPEIGFNSYDRFFPSQDTLPNGGFGNLIALPLQYSPRQIGNSCFLDDSYEPFFDQWAFLSGIRRISRAEVAVITAEATRNGRVFDLRLPSDNEDEEPWLLPPSRCKPLPKITEPLPKSINVVLGNQIYIPRIGLPPSLINRLIRIAAFQNPAFYSAQAMRRSTYNIPRVIVCSELLSQYIALPRGCRESMENLLEEIGVEIHFHDKRFPGRPIESTFLGE